jgi:hypothetical protein
MHLAHMGAHGCGTGRYELFELEVVGGLGPNSAATCAPDLVCRNGGYCGTGNAGSLAWPIGATDHCVCPDGFTGTRCTEFACDFLNGGTCSAPYQCVCRPGYSGARLALDVEVILTPPCIFH